MSFLRGQISANNLVCIHYSDNNPDFTLQIGGMLWDAGVDADLHYMYIFGVGLAGKALTLFFLVTRLEMFKVTPEKLGAKTLMVSSSGIPAEWWQKKRIG